MNNIEILEKLVERCKECKFATCEQCEINWCEVQAIKNLLEKNKELKEELKICEADLDEMTISNDHKKKEWVNKLVLNSYIPKSKVKEKIEELFNEMDELDEEFDNEFDEDIVNDKRNLQDTIIVLKELLEGE